MSNYPPGGAPGPGGTPDAGGHPPGQPLAGQPTQFAGGPPSAAPGFQPAEPEEKKRGGRILFLLLGLLAFVGAVGVGAFLGGVFGGAADDEEATPIFLSAAGDLGQDPFSEEPLVDAELPEIAQPVTMDPVVTSIGLTLTADSGGTPGLYGGTRDKAACDVRKMVDFLEGNPAKAAAWADALNADPNLQFDGGQIQVSTIADYVATLTPGILLEDTAVTNHGFSGGRANQIDDILQKGHAVLIDAFGVPRVKCLCGNPLLPPREITGEVTYQGKQWEDFDPGSVRQVNRNAARLQAIVMVDLDTGDQFERPVGTSGDADADPGQSGASTTTTTEDGTDDSTTTSGDDASTTTSESTTTTEETTTTSEPTTTSESTTTETSPPTTTGPSLCSPGSDSPADLLLVNRSNGPVELYWHNFNCQLELYATLQPGESVTQGSFIGHFWRATKATGESFEVTVERGGSELVVS
ncbi:MAG: DUF6777 domain-containing protein [Actinomycetota bacterium]